MNLSKTAGLLIISLITTSVNAHVPFLKPNQFNVHHDRLQIESSFTEFPFQADFAMEAPQFIMVSPEAVQTILTPSAKTKAALYLEPTLKQNGTYRIHAGLRKGPKYNAIETAEGKLYFADDMKNKTGKKTFLQYYSSADTYLSKGTPAYMAGILGSGVEIIPLTSPNQLYLNGSLTLRVYQDGKPVPDARIVVVYDNEHFEKHRIEDLYDVENVRKSNIIADKEGKFTFTPRKAGMVLLFVNIHRKINDSLWESYNNSLSLEVNLPVN